jgi:hypothetical protein
MNTTLWLGAAIGALVAAVVNGVANWLIKREEIKVQRLGIAMKCAELKHQQLVAAQDWAIKEGRPRDIDLWDPLVSVIDYMNGLDEFERTGGWARGKRDKPERGQK